MEVCQKWLEQHILCWQNLLFWITLYFTYQALGELEVTKNDTTSQDTIESIADNSENSQASTDGPEGKVEKVKAVKKPDMSSPIEVTDHMEVMVKGKKCLLKVNPETGQLCAYPLILSGE